MKNIFNLSSAEFAYRVIKIEVPITATVEYILLFFFRENKA